MMKLIGSLSSPYVRKVRIVLAEKKIDYQFVLEDVWSASTQIHVLNPLGKIPCLIMEDGGAVFDSRVIAEYADTLSPVARLIPPSGRERVEVRCWEALTDGMLDAAVLVRLEHTQRSEAQRSQVWIERQLQKIDNGLKSMAHGLGDKPWCSNNHYTLADIAAGCALGYLDFRLPQIDWRGDYPNLARYYDKLAARPSFQSTMPQ